MKKVGAILAAVAMVVVAFVIRGGGDSDDGGDGGGDVSQIICPTDLKAICDHIDGVDVTYQRAGTTADELIGAVDGSDVLDGTAWVVPAAWAEAVQDTRTFDATDTPAIDPTLFVASEPIASTNVVVAYFEESVSELCPSITWTCLASHLGSRFRVGSPPLTGATGLPVAAAQLTEILGTTEFGPDDVRRLPSFTRSNQAFRDMRTLGPAGFAAVGTTSAEAHGVTGTNTGIPFTVIREPDVRIDLVIVTRRGRSLSGDLEDAITDAFRAAHWDPPGSGPSGMPDGDLLNVIREKDS